MTTPGSRPRRASDSPVPAVPAPRGLTSAEFRPRPARDTAAEGRAWTRRDRDLDGEWDTDLDTELVGRLGTPVENLVVLAVCLLLLGLSVAVAIYAGEVP